jgi:cell division protein FtsQ
MDGRGRLAQPLKGLLRRCALWPARAARRLPRGFGILATMLMLLAAVGYGIIKGDHVSAFVQGLHEARDGAANAAGLRIASIALSGNQHISREEVLAVAGITGASSLLFLDVDEARERLKLSPWVADATVLKLYPRVLQISIKERAAFALWQKDGKVSVIAEDGTVLQPYVAPDLLRLPLVVGSGAQNKARDLLAVLGQFPGMRDFVRASILVGERRWNLRLKNGIEVKLPERDPASALERLVALDHEKNLITRDIVVIDLRLPDRVSVRLSDAAAQARLEALKEKPQKKGGNA